MMLLHKCESLPHYAVEGDDQQNIHFCLSFPFSCLWPWHTATIIPEASAPLLALGIWQNRIWGYNCHPNFTSRLHYDLRNAHQALALTNITQAEFLLHLSETLSVLHNLCCPMSSFFFNIQVWKFIFLTWRTIQVEQYFCYWNFKGSYWPKLHPGWKIITPWTNSLVTFKQWSLTRLFELS